MSQQRKIRILLILTGGTICSFADEHGERQSDVAQAEALIVKHFRESDSALQGEDAVSFECHRPLDVLSENMTVAHWNTLIDDLKRCDFSCYDGVILLHGTDTLAYTACLLSLLLEGTPIPVMLVSAQLPIDMPDSNGNHNFRRAVELIAGGTKNVVCAQPFGCLPNHIVGQGMMKIIRENHPGVNLVSIDYDSSASRINQENRLKLMLAGAARVMQEEEAAKAAAEAQEAPTTH